MTEKRLKTATLNLRIDPQLKAAADAAAAAERRSLTSLIEKLLADWLRENGYLPKQP
jgi:predicted HicB family RNase H-like nuclease